MLIESFLFSVIENDDANVLFKVKDTFVAPKELPYIDFVKDFYANYKKLPDLTTVEAKFNIQLQDNTEKPDYWYKEIVDKYQEYVIEQAVLGSAKNKKKAIDIMQQAIVDYNVDVDAQIIDYADGKKRAKSYDARKGSGGITYLSTGNADLDMFSSGYKRADLWTIGGREGAGKTWFLLRQAIWLDEYLIDKGISKPILIVSGEMDAEELEERIDAIKCEISYSRLSKGDLNPAEERKYKRFLQGVDTNIKIVDTFDNLKDVEYFMTIYRPAMTFIDGSHLLSSSYDWGEIAKVTSGMKRLTRNMKIPIVNTTHLKSEKGTSAKGGNMDDFAYTKGYTRDSDIVGVMFASDMMEIENKVGIDWVKIRRGSRTQLIWENDYETCKTELIDSKVGSQIVASSSGANSSTGSKRGNANGGAVDLDY